MPEAPNASPLPRCCYCQNCNASLMNQSMQFSENASSRRWGSATISYQNGYPDEEISDEETSDTSDGEYTCEHCENDVTRRVHQISEIAETIQRYFREHNLPNGAGEPVQRFNLQIFLATADEEEPARFTDIVAPHAAQLMNQIGNFNITHESYTGIETATEEPNNEERGPEQSQPILSEDHHRRWNNGVNYPNSTMECPACSFQFIVENREDCICPRCKQEINEAELQTASPRVTIRF